MRLFGRRENSMALAIGAAQEMRAARELDGDSNGLFEANALNQRINDAMKKSLTYDQFQAWDQADDQGNYFGQEFDIRATAGRLKALYKKEPWIYTSATYVTKSLATVPFKVRNPQNKELIEKHPLYQLLNASTVRQSNMEMRWNEGIDMMLGGNFFLVFEPGYKKLVGIAPVERTTPILKKDYTEIEFIEVESEVPGKKVRFPMTDVVHVKLPNPDNPFYGLSPFCAAARPILLDRYKAEYEMAFYLRGATSNGVIETTEDLSKSRFKRLMLSFEAAFTGRSNWWRTLFLPKGASWKASTLTMKEAQHLEGLKENRKTILAVLGIPPSQVGLIEDVNRATSEQQERAFWAGTISPIANFIASGWNQSHLVREVFKGKVEVFPDFSGIEAIEGFVSAKSEKSKAMEPTHWIDEIREKVWGDEPLPNGAGQKFVAEIKSAPQTQIALAMGGVMPEPKPVLPAPVKAVIPDGLEVQALMFPKDVYKVQADAQSWARANGYMDEPCEEVVETWIIRQHGPELYDELKEVPLVDAVRCMIGKRKDDSAKAFRVELKLVATNSQNRVEDTAGKDFTKAYGSYLNLLLDEAARAIRGQRDVKKSLQSLQHERLDAFLKDATPIYNRVLERGFTANNSQVKNLMGASTKRARFTGLSETDNQAVDVLRERSRDDRRRVLEQRNIQAFKGLDATRTEQVMQLVENGEKQGLSFDKIAETIRDRYEDSYANQARTIVRTEILSAYSEGLNWNHQILGEVFSETSKEWMHQGDEGINPHARPEHVELDGTEVMGDEPFVVIDATTGESIELWYPRDPRAPAGQIINCRCTMVSVIPDSAISNAEAILAST